MRNLHKTKNKAFTLIELLVVIAIIALLASIVLVALGGARSKARMATRVGDLRQLQTALELYYSDNGSYPSSNNNYYSQCGASIAATPVSSANAVIPGLAPSYLASVPADPTMNTSGGTNCIMYTSNGTDYKVLDIQITDVTPQQIATQYSTYTDPDRDYYSGGSNTCGTNYANASLAIYSPGGRCW